MFSLIITIISIALVAALALATLYFGGDAFNQGSAKAAAATVVNQASQISGANTLNFLDNQAYDTVANLATNDYLASVPDAGNISANAYVVDTSTGSVSLTAISQAVCDAVNAQSGHTETNQADVATAVGAMTGEQFGCDAVGAVGAEVPTFLFK